MGYRCPGVALTMTAGNQDSPSARFRIWAAGQALGKYELLLPVARGGMAQVWAARPRHSQGFQRLVAIKTILPDLDQCERMERMLLDEASFAARIRHPNVIETLELGEEHGVLYLVMEWFDAEPLNVVAQLATAAGGMPIEPACNLIAQVCRGLHAVHELSDEAGVPLGLVHRDVSPQNILVNHVGVAKLLDLGIAKATNRDTAVTGHGEVKGKFTYMAPEQLRGEALDRRTDVFALGVVLYSLTTNLHPFRGRSVAETIRKINSNKAVLPPSRTVKDYPAEVEAVLTRALAKDRDRRYRTALEFAGALEAALPGAFGAAAEARLEQYLRPLLEDKLKQRFSLIRKAQIERDSGRPYAEPTSVGSLKAITVDTSRPAALLSAREAETQAVAQLPPPGRPRIRQLLAVGAAAAVLLAVAVSAPRFHAQTPAARTPPPTAAAVRPERPSPEPASTGAIPPQPSAAPDAGSDAGPRAAPAEPEASSPR